MKHTDPPGLFDPPESSNPEQRLCERLIYADTEAEVEEALKAVGYWDDIEAWAIFGDNAANASVIGGQQEAADAALVEKIVNSIDARMLDACHKAGLNPQDVDNVPQTGVEAVARWFDHGMNTDQVSRSGNIAAWSPSKRDEQAEQITVAATGSLDGFASITIADSGEGQEPDRFAATFCSLNTGNKRSIAFVQGKHTMGGTGALRFCGAGRVHAHNLQLIVSRRNPAYGSEGSDTPWGFTLVRRFPTQGAEKTATYRYLAPGGQILRFNAEELGIFPQSPDRRGRAEPYGRMARWGTLTKLYEYIETPYITRAALSGTRLPLARQLELCMPSALLPVKLYECRHYRKVSDLFPTMVLTGIMGHLATLTNPAKTLEWGGSPKTLQFRVEGQLFNVTVWAFKKTAQEWRRSDGVLFTLSGQTHAARRDGFFSRKNVDLDVLRKSLLVVVDCSEISSDHEAALFMTSRDRLAGSEFARQVQEQLAKELGEHPALKKLRNERARYGGNPDEQVQKSVREFLEACLQDNPDLGKLLIDGTDIPNPHKPFSLGDQEPKLRKFPTFFRLSKARNNHLRRDAHLGRDYHRFMFETDARDDYFDRHDAPGARFLDMSVGTGPWISAEYLVEGWHLNNGSAEMKLRLPDDAQVGDIINYKFTVTDDNHETSDFVSTIELTVKAPQEPSESGTNRKSAKRQPPKVDAPEIKPVRQEQWSQQAPEPFDASTALRKVDIGDGRYEFRFNVDNKYLQKEIVRVKATDAQTETLTRQFGSIMAGLALLVMGAEPLLTADEIPDDLADTERNGTEPVSTNDLVDWYTAAAAPVVASIQSFTDPSRADSDLQGDQ